ncbi:MAG TPA: hypothetical protein PLD46_04700 [Hyphomicrobium sp.]|nr:hypothetical protein [Hyphomicrobium sp.]
MLSVSLDRQLHMALLEIPEIAAAGFSVREGLTGAGVTVLKGRTYFGSWRETASTLVWVSSNIGDPNYFVDTVDEALRHTLLLILRNLEMSSRERPLRAVS